MQALGRMVFPACPMFGITAVYSCGSSVMGLDVPSTFSAVRAKGKGVALARAYGRTGV